MNPYVADPEWGWWIVLYFFLGGIAAGAYSTATLIDLLGGEADRDLPRAGYVIALPLIVLCGVFLIVDLHRPERFWHMLFKSEVVHAALDDGWPWSAESWQWMADAPLLKYWSPMSIGSWALSLFGLCSTLSLLGSIWREGRLNRWFRRSLFGKLLAVIGCLAGYFVAAYTGALLTATNQPLWSDSVWIAPLFLTSAASTGIAAMILLARWRKLGTPEALERLELADLWAIGLELIFFSVFVASLGSLLVPVLHTTAGILMILGTLLLGLLGPLALRLRFRATISAAILALVGGFLLRWGIVNVAPELLEHPAAWAAGFGPEDGRPRGGGPGADPGNRAGDLQPRSKFPPQDE